MLGYYTRLALMSFRRNPGLTLLMILAIALGISSCVMTITVYHAESANPIWWKSDRLFNVHLDPLPTNAPPSESHPGLGEIQLTYHDARYLVGANIAPHAVMGFKTASVISLGGASGARAHPLKTRVTTADFFTMFDTPFQYGGGWKSQADWAPEPVIVLSHFENQRLFGGANSVGRTVRWHDKDFRVLGVLDRWRPTPKFYDLNNYPFEAIEGAFVPMGWAPALKLLSAGNSNCWGAGNDLKTYQAYLQSDCAWVQLWLELPNAASVQRAQAFIENYHTEQQKVGRFGRSNPQFLYNVDEWLKALDIAGSDNRVLIGLAAAFLVVCLINTVGLLLARFLKAAPIAGVRRALGASRRQIFIQHLIEVGVVSAAGALLSIPLSWLGMWGLRVLYATSDFDQPDGPPDLTHIDVTSVSAAVLLAVAATLIAGLYPAWRAGRINPAAYLKSQ